jgi:hypothetical protein
MPRLEDLSVGKVGFVERTGEAPVSASLRGRLATLSAA